jgi:hypothetical protein
LPTPAKTRKLSFRYQRRTPEQWRAAARDGLNGELIGRRTTWLAKVLNAAANAWCLSDWQLSFCHDLDQRFARYGKSLALSDKQLSALKKIETKLRQQGCL